MNEPFLLQKDHLPVRVEQQGPVDQPEPEQPRRVVDQPKQPRRVSEQPEQVVDQPEQPRRVVDQPEQPRRMSEQPEQVVSAVARGGAGGAGPPIIMGRKNINI